MSAEFFCISDFDVCTGNQAEMVSCNSKRCQSEKRGHAGDHSGNCHVSKISSAGTGNGAG